MPILNNGDCRIYWRGDGDAQLPALVLVAGIVPRPLGQVRGGGLVVHAQRGGLTTSTALDIEVLSLDLLYDSLCWGS